jgi:hypothetical protein
MQTFNVKPGVSQTETYTRTYIHAYTVCLPLSFNGLSRSDTRKCDTSCGSVWNSSCYLYTRTGYKVLVYELKNITRNILDVASEKLR